MTTTSDLLSDLSEEQQHLDEVVSALDPQRWDLPTPAEAWTIRDSISHLAFFEEIAVIAATDPVGFETVLQEIASDPPSYMDKAPERGRQLSPDGVLEWWRRERSSFLDAAAGLPSDALIAWVGPPMKAMTFITARLMETFAHGQDVLDALGVERKPAERLRHIAHLGVRTRAFCYSVRGRTMPEGDVRVELSGPGGGTWGESDTDVISGPAVDFCLLVTRRRHVDDTALEVRGDNAREWALIAQAFAGPPGEDRPPGRFRVDR